MRKAIATITVRVMMITRKPEISIALMTPDQQERLVQNIVESLSGARQEIQMRQLCHFFRADVKYGMQIAQGLGIAIDPAMIPASAQPVGV
jgi:catalase